MWKMLRWLVWLFVCTVFSRAQDVNFSIPSTTCNNGHAHKIRCDHDAHDLDGHIEMTKDSKLGDSLYSSGYVFYTDRVRMLDPNTGQSASFSTSFTFSITTHEVFEGDGISFVMLANETYRGDPGVTMGIYKYVYNVTSNTASGLLPQPTKTFCVEFDTFQNHLIPDPSDNHVGVDLESIISKKTEEAGRVGIDLKSGHLITSWIDYDFSSLDLEVRIAYASNAKPAAALLNFPLNLSHVVDEFMWVGIAASTGARVEYTQLYSWSFAAFGLPPLKSGKSKTGLIVGVSVGVASAVLLSYLGCVACRALKAKKYDILSREDFQSELAVVDMPFKFTYKQLSVATNGFSERSKLGEGGSSSVYRGVIASTGTLVAVKRVANKAKQGEKEFLGEIRVVSRLRHRNLVKLLGWCTDRGNYLLVYELMPNGSLDKLLFDDDGSIGVLSWAQRLTIVRGVAAGLGYLHQGYVQQVIHRDIKSSNVMLDEQLHARVGDFGLARLIDHSKNLATTQLAGTVGYIAPEAVLMWKSTDKTDVYAFGALILEVACGRRPIDTNAPQEGIILVDWVWNCHAQGNILRAADARLAGDFPESEMEHMLLMGLLCSHPDPNARPPMRQVELILAGDVPLPPVPLIKPVLVFSSTQVKLLKEVITGKHLNSGSSGGSLCSSSSTKALSIS